MPRSQRWSGAETPEEAVKIAANQFHGHRRKGSKRRIFKSSLLNLEVEPVSASALRTPGDGELSTGLMTTPLSRT